MTAPTQSTPAAGAGGARHQLTALDIAVLEFADLRWRRTANRDEALAARLGMTPAQYFTRLTVLVDDPRALAVRPQTVLRLQEVREQRAAVRERCA